MTRVDYTLSELLEIRGSIGSLIDILDEELESERNADDLSVSRKAMLDRQILLCNLLDKTNKAIKNITTPRAALAPGSRVRSRRLANTLDT
jgi:hypothetical protein